MSKRPPLVFLHGFLGKGSDWEAVCSYLPPCRIYCPDLPGHGNSPFTENFTLDLPDPTFHLIGYSMGGRLAAAYAEKNPQRIASLTLLSTHPGLRTEEEKKKRWESDSRWAKLLFELPIDEFLARWYDQPVFKPYVPDLTLRKKQNIAALVQSLLHNSLSKQPVYELDQVLVGEYDEKFRALYKNPILVPKSGHMIHLENPQAVAIEIQRRIYESENLDPLRTL